MKSVATLANDSGIFQVERHNPEKDGADCLLGTYTYDYPQEGIFKT